VILRWIGDRPFADREMIAHLYQVSERSVRRHCRPADYEARGGQRRGNAMYDALAADVELARVAPRPARAAAAQRLRRRAAAQTVAEVLGTGEPAPTGAAEPAQFDTTRIGSGTLRQDPAENGGSPRSTD
jgi:hypothetical protein